MKKTVLAACAAVMMLNTPVTAAGLIPEGACAIVVASRKSLEDANQYIHLNGLEEYATVYEAANGWLAVSVATVASDRSKRILADLKAGGMVPDDAYCTVGKRFVRVLATPTKELVKRKKTS